MVSALDIAKYLLELAEREPEPELISNLRLQKLLYYVQGWHLAQHRRPIFAESIEGWKHGPVVRNVYRSLKGQDRDSVTSAQLNGQPLPIHEQVFVDSIWEAYKGYSASRLYQMTHREQPWIEARAGLSEADPGDTPLSHDTMFDFFSMESMKRRVPGLEDDHIERAAAEFAEGRGVAIDEALAEWGLNGLQG